MPHAEQSMLNWVVSSLGPIYVILLPLSAIVSFVAVLILVTRGRGPMAAVSILLFLLAPTLIGIFGYLHAATMNNFEIYNGCGTPDPNVVMKTDAAAIFSPLVGMFLSIPAFALAAIGTLMRSFGPKSNSTTNMDAV